MLILKKLIYISLACSSAFACSVPVFRYALEYWQPDPYQIILSYNSTGTNNLPDVLDEINKYKNNRSFTLRKIKDPKSTGKIILKYPASTRIQDNVYENYLTKENFNKILQSPLRQKLINKITSGDSLIFLLLEGSDKKQNNHIANIILKNIPIFEKEIKLPYEYTNIPKEDLKSYYTNIVFKLSMIKLSRTNAEENVFINILTKSLPEKIYKKSDPIVFPIFARGRMLAALREKEVNYRILKNICEYVAGECSCEIKSQNPGFDIFIPLGWNLEKNKALISNVILPPLSGFSEFLPSKKTAVNNSSSKK